MAHKGLKLSKRFTNLLLGVNVINFELNGFHASTWVPQTSKSYNALIEVFKFISYMKKKQDTFLDLF